MVLWDDDQVEIKKLARLIRGENLQLFIDFGPEKLLKDDRAIEKYEDTRMHQILERKKYSHRLTVHLPSAGKKLKLMIKYSYMFRRFCKSKLVSTRL